MMESFAAAVNGKEKDKERDIAKEREKEKEKEREKEREREREGEMEAALYANCLLLGLDSAVLGQGVGQRVGLFKHSNPRVGEALLHFLLCALRGPSLSAKDFAGVWPIFDAAQSRDFRKIVQSIINDLEAQGALPRSNSRVSSLATCCGQRFVELLWQLSAHALREVHKRSFPADVAANPLPASLTEVVSQNAHAAALLPITKARIALERKRFLEGASLAVRRQALWSSLANDMTAEFRALCAEEAYLHQELEKMQELQDSKGRTLDGVKVSSGGYPIEQDTLSVSVASELWESLLMHAAQHEKLASGPVEDLIGHREHRYRIDGSVLRAVIDRGAGAIHSEAAVLDDTVRQRNEDDGLLSSGTDGSRDRLDMYRTLFEGSAIDEARSRADERPGKLASQLDVAEILRRWTHALHRLHKQAMRLARSNDGAGPDLLKDALGQGENGHSHALHANLTEHRQHLANMKVLVGQLKESIPGMEAAVASLREQVNSSDSVTACVAAQSALSGTTFPSGASTITMDGNGSYNLDNSNKGFPLELVPPSPALKLPQLLSTSPTSLENITRLQKRFNSFSQLHSLESLREEDTAMVAGIGRSGHEDGSDVSEEAIASLRQAVRDAALSQPAFIQETIPDKLHYASEHYFTPIAFTNVGRSVDEKKPEGVVQKQRRLGNAFVNKALTVQQSSNKMWKTTQDLRRTGAPENLNESAAQKASSRSSSPPLLMDLPTLDAYDDLLAPLSDLDILQ